MNEITLTIGGETIPLDERCPGCRGAGMLETYEWAAWWATPPEERGEAPDGPQEIPCDECDGRGRRPTAVGRAILMLVGRYANE